MMQERLSLVIHSWLKLINVPGCAGEVFRFIEDSQMPKCRWVILVYNCSSFCPSWLCNYIYLYLLTWEGDACHLIILCSGMGGRKRAVRCSALYIRTPISVPLRSGKSLLLPQHPLSMSCSKTSTALPISQRSGNCSSFRYFL